MRRLSLLNPPAQQVLLDLPRRGLRDLVAVAPGLSSTKAHGVSPHFSSGFATTATAATAGCA
jgi:hypothetical protein